MFSCLKEFQLSLLSTFHDDVFHITLIHSPYLMVSHDIIFMSMICVGPKAYHSSFDDDQLIKLYLLMILCLISDRFMIKILVGAKLNKGFEDKLEASTG